MRYGGQLVTAAQQRLKERETSRNGAHMRSSQHAVSSAQQTTHKTMQTAHNNAKQPTNKHERQHEQRHDDHDEVDLGANDRQDLSLKKAAEPTAAESGSTRKW